jgi:hypothetical protein
MFLHNHLPTIQVLEDSDNKDNSRYFYKQQALLNFLRFIDTELNKGFEREDIRMIFHNKERIEKNYSSSEYFFQYLEIVFNVKDYEKERKPRGYSFKNYFNYAFYNSIKYLFIEKSNKIDKLFKSIEITGNDFIDKYVYENIKFTESKFYEKSYLEEDMLNGKNYGNRDANVKIDYKKRLDEILIKGNVKLTTDENFKDIYSYTDIKKSSTEKTRTFKYITSKETVEIKKLKDCSKEQYPTKVIIDKELILKQINKFMKDENNYLYIFPLINIYKFYSSNNNHIIYEAKNFRLNSKAVLNHGINFQAIKSKYRKLLFPNQWDYDLETGVQTLLLQYIKRVLPEENIKFPSIEAYIKDKNKIRNKCKEILEKRHPNEKNRDFKKEIKKVITAPLYGGNILNHESDLEMPFEDRKHLFEHYLGFTKLILESEKLLDYLQLYINKNFADEEVIKMPNGEIHLYEGVKQKKPIASVATSFYYSLEAQCLDVIYKKYKKDITLLIYDGFIARKDIDTKELEELVLKETGFVVKYSKELIKPDL